MYLPVALQLKGSYLKAGPPCLGMCASPDLAVFVPEVGPASASIIALTVAVAAWKATHVTTMWIASVSVTSA